MKLGNYNLNYAMRAALPKHNLSNCSHKEKIAIVNPVKKLKGELLKNHFQT